MPLARIVSFVEDGPWCGTRIPGFHPPRPGQAVKVFGDSLAAEIALNPQPLPPLGEAGAFLWHAVRLHQYANQLNNAKVGGEAAQSLFTSAKTLYDDGQCGSIPWQLLLRWLGHPPPPPPPWLELIGLAVGNAIFGARVGGEFGRQLQHAASALIHDQTGARNSA
jgi:hypothetical protein